MDDLFPTLWRLYETRSRNNVNRCREGEATSGNIVAVIGIKLATILCR